ESRRGRDGDLEVKLEPAGGARAVELDYRPGAPEIGGLGGGAGGVVGLGAFRRAARGAEPRAGAGTGGLSPPVGAGLAGGIVTAMVGGASLITFPALLAAGLPPIVANATSTVALTPGNLVAGLADLERMPRWDRTFASLALIAVAGSAAGAALLLATPERAFTAVVPLLIAFATILFALSGRIRLWIVSRGG